MTTVTLNQSPTQEIVAKAQAEVTVKDAKGRVITLRKPGVLAQFRLVEVLGETARNDVYMNMAFPMIYVAAIDGEQVFQPAKKSEFEALLQRLDEDGVAAVVRGVADNFSVREPEADKAALKN